MAHRYAASRHEIFFRLLFVHVCLSQVHCGFYKGGSKMEIRSSRTTRVCCTMHQGSCKAGPAALNDARNTPSSLANDKRNRKLHPLLRICRIVIPLANSGNRSRKSALCTCFRPLTTTNTLQCMTSCYNLKASIIC